MVIKLEILLLLLGVLKLSTGNHNNLIMDNGNSCNLYESIEKEEQIEFDKISNNFLELVDEIGYDERKGYMITLTFIFKVNTKRDDLKLHLFKLIDYRKSIQNKKLFHEKCELLIAQLLPKYESFLDKEKIDLNCEFVSLVIKLRACT